MACDLLPVKSCEQKPVNEDSRKVWGWSRDGGGAYLAVSFILRTQKFTAREEWAQPLSMGKKVLSTTALDPDFPEPSYGPRAEHLPLLLIYKCQNRFCCSALGGCFSPLSVHLMHTRGDMVLESLRVSHLLKLALYLAIVP